MNKIIVEFFEKSFVSLQPLTADALLTESTALVEHLNKETNFL